MISHDFCDYCGEDKFINTYVFDYYPFNSELKMVAIRSKKDGFRMIQSINITK